MGNISVSLDKQDVFKLVDQLGSEEKTELIDQIQNTPPLLAQICSMALVCWRICACVQAFKF